MKRSWVLAVLMLLVFAGCAHAPKSGEVLWVWLAHTDGRPIAGVGATDTPYTQGGPFAVAALNPSGTARTADGMVISGIGIRAWRERGGARVQVYAMTPKGDQDNEYLSDVSRLQEQEFASYHIEAGKHLPIAEMAAFGAEDLVLRCYWGAP